MWIERRPALVALAIAAALALGGCGSNAARPGAPASHDVPGETDTVTLAVQGMT